MTKKTHKITILPNSKKSGEIRTITCFCGWQTSGEPRAVNKRIEIHDKVKHKDIYRR